MSKDTLKAWMQASRLPFFVATFIPLFIGWSLAIRETGQIRPLRFILILIASLIVHLITNLANDYFDHLGGTDAGKSIGGSRVIQEGKISPDVMWKVIVVLYTVAFVIAVVIVAGFGLYLLSFPILFAAVSSYFYVAPPIRYGYHGLGELFVGINMGPIMVAGTYWVIASEPSLLSLIVSIPVGLMVALILFYQSLPDMQTDLAVNKHTLAVKLGKRNSLYVLILFFVAIYLSISALIIIKALSQFSLLYCLSLPLCIRLIRIVFATKDFVLLDQYGKYVRIIYFICGLSIIAGILL
jgi:1,4-dihydroxy-2-naphthoate octaprenyltransferase